jgi:hypothetical protein
MVLCVCACGLCGLCVCVCVDGVGCLVVEAGDRRVLCLEATVIVFKVMVLKTRI